MHYPAKIRPPTDQEFAEILRRVGAGESYVVTNNGRPVAILSPVPQSRLEELLAVGIARPATRSELPSLDRVHAPMDSTVALDELKGER